MEEERRAVKGEKNPKTLQVKHKYQVTNTDIYFLFSKTVSLQVYFYIITQYLFFKKKVAG